MDEQQNDAIEAGDALDPPLAGGDGGSSESTLTERRAARLESRAIRQRWPIDPEYREVLIKRLMGLALDKNTPIREVRQLAQTIVNAEGQNQADEHKRQPDTAINLHVTPEHLARMSDHDLHEYRRRIAGD